jgi:hypothetical protein
MVARNHRLAKKSMIIGCPNPGLLQHHIEKKRKKWLFIPHNVQKTFKQGGTS